MRPYSFDAVLLVREKYDNRRKISSEMISAFFEIKKKLEPEEITITLADKLTLTTSNNITDIDYSEMGNELIVLNAKEIDSAINCSIGLSLKKDDENNSMLVLQFKNSKALLLAEKELQKRINRYFISSKPIWKKITWYFMPLLNAVLYAMFNILFAYSIQWLVCKISSRIEIFEITYYRYYAIITWVTQSIPVIQFIAILDKEIWMIFENSDTFIFYLVMLLGFGGYLSTFVQPCECCSFNTTEEAASNSRDTTEAVSNCVIMFITLGWLIISFKLNQDFLIKKSISEFDRNHNRNNKDKEAKLENNNDSNANDLQKKNFQHFCFELKGYWNKLTNILFKFGNSCLLEVYYWFLTVYFGFKKHISITILTPIFFFMLTCGIYFLFATLYFSKVAVILCLVLIYVIYFVAIIVIYSNILKLKNMPIVKKLKENFFALIPMAALIPLLGYIIYLLAICPCMLYQKCPNEFDNLPTECQIVLDSQSNLNEYVTAPCSISCLVVAATIAVIISIIRIKHFHLHPFDKAIEKKNQWKKYWNEKKEERELKKMELNKELLEFCLLFIFMENACS